MSFEESLQNEMPVKYRNMSNNQTASPFEPAIKLGQYSTFEQASENYHERLESERKEFNDCLDEIIKKRDKRLRAENDAESRRRARAAHIRFLCVEWIKTIAFNIPTMALFIAALILLRDPDLILDSIPAIWVLVVYLAAFVLSMVVAGIVVWKSNKVREAYKFVQQRCAIMIAGAMINFALMILGLLILSDPMI